MDGLKLQRSQNKSHNHDGSVDTDGRLNNVKFDTLGSWNGANLYSENCSWGSGGSAGIKGGDGNDIRRMSITLNHKHTVSISSDGGTEARPDNYTIRIWKRVS